MIKLEDCVDGGTYKIGSRNLSYGVFRKETSGFIGIREKFFNEYLFEEFHWDTGPPFGTVTPSAFIEMCPISPINEDNDALFEYLKKIENEKGTSYGGKFRNGITEQQLLLSEHVTLMNTYGVDSNELKVFMDTHKDKPELISLCETAMTLKKALTEKSEK